MIYISTKEKLVIDFWQNNFKKDFKVKHINLHTFSSYSIVGDNDVLVLDIDQFDTLDDVVQYIEELPKKLKLIAYLKAPKVVHGAYLIKKGFRSYLGKDTPRVLIAQAIKTVLEDNLWLYPELMNYIIKNIHIEQENPNDNLFESLTQKEIEVTHYIAQGLSNREIAQKMDIQLVTVKKHLGSVFGKLNVKDRLSLAILVNK
jgi:two-component system nitrate/nitrite response regulator NarL